MNNNTKHSEETYIRWSVNMNSAIEVGQIEPEPILTIHPDGRVTTSDRLKPTETAALVLDQIKTQWMRDGQATKIRQLQDRIKRLEEELTDTKNKHSVLVADVVLYEDRADRIKQLEDRIHRAATAFFRDGSDGHVASQMLQILEEERYKK